MELNSQAQKLIQNLDELSKLYQALQDVLRLEREALISSDLKKLSEKTKAKEVMLYKIRALDKERQALAQALAFALGMLESPTSQSPQPRLLEMAKKCETLAQKDLAHFLREKHKVLALHIGRVQEQNSENEIYARSALQVLHGAMNEIKQTVTEKPTYGNQGKMSGSLETQAGNFVSKEA